MVGGGDVAHREGGGGHEVALEVRHRAVKDAVAVRRHARLLGVPWPNVVVGGHRGVTALHLEGGGEGEARLIEADEGVAEAPRAHELVAVTQLIPRLRRDERAHLPYGRGGAH